MGATSLQIRIAGELAAIAYTDEGAPPGSLQQKQDIESALQALQPQMNGPFQLVWGPANNQGVLAYVALSADKKTYVLAFRGSLSDVDAYGFFKNWICDIGTFKQVPWLYPAGKNAMISSGMNVALALVTGLIDPATNEHLIDYLRSVHGKNGSLDLIVAGHSLGGALTQLSSLWLYDQLVEAGGLPKITITPMTFAAPNTANQQFGSLYNAAFPNAYTCVNTLDVAPMAWENMDGIQRMYPRPGTTLTEWGVAFDLIVTAYKDKLGTEYRPVGGQVDTFTGWMPATTASFGQIAAVNHSHDTYLDHVRVETYPDLKI